MNGVVPSLELKVVFNISLSNSHYSPLVNNNISGHTDYELMKFIVHWYYKIKDKNIQGIKAK